ncbi:SDR family oxidoreductase [Myxococcota bacterium]|nr:SDR family oxidoreductase [Myxococcota bacterium]
MRILLTGGAGFIGSHLCDRLLARGDEVTVVDNLVTGDLQNLEHIRDPRFRFVEHDIGQPLIWPDPVDAVFNLACPASPVDYIKLPLETLRVGAHGAWNMLEIAREKGALFLQASTSEVYGDPEVHPQPESYHGHVNPIGPRSVYDESKRYTEALVMAFRRTHGVRTRMVRIFNTYGPRMRLDDGRVIPNFFTQALRGDAITVYGDGSQTRSFCYVSDLVEGIVALSEADFAEPVNLGNPIERTVLDLAREVIRITGSSSRVEFRELPQDDPKLRRPVIDRARAVLGWEPRVGLEEGLELTLADFSARIARAAAKAART